MGLMIADCIIPQSGASLGKSNGLVQMWDVMNVAENAAVPGNPAKTDPDQLAGNCWSLIERALLKPEIKLDSKGESFYCPTKTC